MAKDQKTDTVWCTVVTNDTEASCQKERIKLEKKRIRIEKERQAAAENAHEDARHLYMEK